MFLPSSLVLCFHFAHNSKQEFGLFSLFRARLQALWRQYSGGWGVTSSVLTRNKSSASHTNKLKEKTGRLNKNLFLVHVVEAFFFLQGFNFLPSTGHGLQNIRPFIQFTCFIINISVASQQEQIKQHIAILQAQTDCKAGLFCLNLCLFRSRHPWRVSRNFKNAGFQIMRQCKWNWSDMSGISHHQLKSLPVSYFVAYM